MLLLRLGFLQGGTALEVALALVFGSPGSWRLSEPAPHSWVVTWAMHSSMEGKIGMT
jgi:hypothetical protein